MIKKSDRNERRILTFPAVHPCEGVSPRTLLISLINLSQNLCSYQSKFFATQRRNAREVIRQIGILLIFFEEINERGQHLSNSVVLCFSELHITFQKLQFLLEDCTREGTKLWILMKSQSVASQFCVLVRSIATALDVLPLEFIDVCNEVKELVELVAKQARKGRLELDLEDDWMLKQVVLILSHFEKGIEPELSTIKRVIDYLEIRSWSDCNKDIKFLENEISVRLSDCNEKEVPLLSSLMGLMSYCRGAIFEDLDNEISNAQADATNNIETLSCLNPEDFRCPISLELMMDPVTVCTGQTYDRSSIQKWLKAGNMICPKTGERLTNPDLVPNTTLRKLIHQLCVDNGISLSKSGNKSCDIMRTIDPGSSAAAEAIKFLSRFLAKRLVFGSNEQKNKAAYEIRLLAKSNIYNRSCLINAGTILPLLNLLSSSSRSTHENAISALLKLSKHTAGKRAIVETGGLRPILSVLNRGLSLESRQIAAATIFYLASVKGYCKLIGEIPEAIPALTELIKNGTNCGKKNAVAAIFSLLLHSANHQRAIEAGTVPLLVDVISSNDKRELIADTLAVLAALSETSDGIIAILKTSAMSIIPRILQSLSSKPGKEYCVSILLSLCNNGGVEAIEVLAKDPPLMSSLYSLITEGTSQGSRKARALIAILHKFNETSSSGLTGSTVRCERPVHVR